MSNTLASGRERPFVLVVGLDLTAQESSGYALEEAMRVASRIPGSEIHVVHVVAAETPADRAHEAAGLLRLYVSEKAAAVNIEGPQRTGIHVRSGDSAEQIAQLAADVGAGAIVVGARRGSHLKSLFVGSTAQRLMAAASCPVLVAGPRPAPQPSHVVVIEAPCPDCVERRLATRGQAWWCARHSEHHHLRRHHVYSYHSELPFAEHDSEVTAVGSD